MSNTVDMPRTTAVALDIEFLYIDLNTCTRCQGTEANLKTALATAQPVLDALGVTVNQVSTRVTSAKQAQQLGLVSSPTIRINGRDIAPDLKESQCGPCSDVCGEATDCRVWTYRGEEFSEAPVGYILTEIMRELAPRVGPPTNQGAPTSVVPENLQRFFAASAQPAADSCCTNAEQATCCAADQKASCCGAAVSGTCGCQTGGAVGS
jgi:hypothetical protein